MHGTPIEVAVANALAAAMADERREKSPFTRRKPPPAETTHTALLRVRDDEDDVAAYIKDVVFADEAVPIPFTDFEDEFDREIVCVDLTDGGSVWVYDLDGEPRWLPQEEFDLRANEQEDEREEADGEEGDEDDGQVSLDSIAWMIFLALILGAALAAALWLAILPSGN